MSIAIYEDHMRQLQLIHWSLISFPQAIKEEVVLTEQLLHISCHMCMHPRSHSQKIACHSCNLCPHSRRLSCHSYSLYLHSRRQHTSCHSCNLFLHSRRRSWKLSCHSYSLCPHSRRQISCHMCMRQHNCSRNMLRSCHIYSLGHSCSLLSP